MVRVAADDMTTTWPFQYCFLIKFVISFLDDEHTPATWPTRMTCVVGRDIWHVVALLEENIARDVGRQALFAWRCG